MTDAPVAQQAVSAAPGVSSEPAVVDMKISFPDVLTTRMWNVYNTAKEAYIREARKQKWEPDIFVGRFCGARAMISAGYLHVEGMPPELSQWLDPKADPNDMPINIAMFVSLYMGVPIENEMYAPLQEILKLSRDFTITPNVTSNRNP